MFAVNTEVITSTFTEMAVEHTQNTKYTKYFCLLKLEICSERKEIAIINVEILAHNMLKLFQSCMSKMKQSKWQTFP